MVGIDVREALARRNYEGELSVRFEGDDSLIDVPFVSFSSPVEAKLRYRIFENEEVEVKGSISFSLKGLCSRCLSETERSFSGEVDALFVPDPAEEGEDYGYTGGKVRLEEALRDALMFALPQRLECETECKLPEWE